MIHLECYHGTSLESGEQIVNEGCFRLPNSEDQLRLGSGVYFFMRASSTSFAQQCAAGYCKVKFRKSEIDKYSVLRCFVECDEDKLLDLYRPDLLDEFHCMRYALYGKIIENYPQYELKDAGELDTLVINHLRRMKGYSVIRAPEYFGPLYQEEMIRISPKNRHRYRKTYLPNVLMLCVDTEQIRIDKIEIVESGSIRRE